MRSSRQRIIRELRLFKPDQSILSLIAVDDTMTCLNAQIVGPPGSPYEGGVFTVKITVPKKYPFTPPDINFTTKIWHPNVKCNDGSVRFFKQAWTAICNLSSLLRTILCHMSDPLINLPWDFVVSRQFKANYDCYLKTARHWTNVYAGGPHSVPEFDTMVVKLKNRGSEDNLARVLLSVENWDFDKALRFV